MDEYRCQQLAQAIMLESDSPAIKRTFVTMNGTVDINRSIVKNANALIQKGGTTRSVTEALLILPAVKWLIKAKRIDDVIAAFSDSAIPEYCTESKELRRLVEMQEILDMDSHGSSRLRLERRAQFIERSEELVQTVEKAVSKTVYTCPGKQSKVTLAGCLLRGKITECDSLTSRHVSRYFGEIVEDVEGFSGERIAYLMERLVPAEVPEEAELAYLYHNVDILMREYSRILYPNSDSEVHNAVMRLLASSNESVRLKYKTELKRSRVEEQAYFLIDYIRLIRGAVEMTRTFPGDEMLFQVLIALLGKGNYSLSDEELAKELNISAAYFSTKKYRAMKLLGAILWGCDAGILLQLLE